MSETGISLEMLCRQVSTPEMELRASRTTADLKIQLLLKNRPLRVLMQAMETLYSGEWRPNDDKQGYTFYPNEEAKKYRDEWWKLFLGERERVIKEQKQLLLAQMREKSATRQVSDPNAPQEPNNQKQESGSQTLYQALPAALQEKIADQMALNSFFGVNLTSSFPKEGGATVALKDLPPAAQEIARAGSPALQNNPEARIHFSNFGFGIVAQLVETGTNWKSVAPVLSARRTASMAVLSLDQKGLMRQVKQLGKDAPEAWKRLAAYQESRVWQNDLPVLQGGEYPNPRRAEVLIWLADKARLEFIADFHSTPHRALLTSERRLPLSRPLKAELDYQAAVQDMSWQTTADGVYLFRNNRWYRDDVLEVPATLLRKWQQAPPAALYGKRMTTQTPREEVLAQIKLELETQAQIVETLSVWQVSNGLLYYVDEKVSRTYDREFNREVRMPFAFTGVRLQQHLNTVRFYASLSAEQRDALIAGRLAVRSLTPDQQKQALFLLPELSEKSLLLEDSRLDIVCDVPTFTVGAPDEGYYSPFLFQFHLLTVPR